MIAITTIAFFGIITLNINIINKNKYIHYYMIPNTIETN